jgi:hypothetical protein
MSGKENRGGIRRAYSMAGDARAAVGELAAGLRQPRNSLVAFFCSPSYELDRLAAQMAERFPGTDVIGCTTAGEITPVGYMDGSITGFSLSAECCCAVTELIPNISELQVSHGADVYDRLAEALARRGYAVDPADTFCLMLIDGLCGNEETVLASLQRRLGAVPMLGGSAGDGLSFGRTYIYHDGQFHRDAALVTLFKLKGGFRTFKHQHFTSTETRMVVTGADTARRVVTEINAEPAGVEYARIIGLPYRELTPMIFAEFPVMVRVGGDYYVRSIQKVNEDASLSFYCAIDEGVVLTLARREDLVKKLADCFTELRREMGQPQLVIGFDCVLRSLEAEARQQRQVVSRLLSENNVIGFSTYGEQFAGMHLNHTFTGVAIGDRARI